MTGACVIDRAENDDAAVLIRPSADRTSPGRPILNVPSLRKRREIESLRAHRRRCRQQMSHFVEPCELLDNPISSR
jgi:hypothetical protein